MGDLFSIKSAAGDLALVGSMGSLPWWLAFFDQASHGLIVAMAVAIGVLRLMILVRQWRRGGGDG